jgi:hypothetical protein
MVTPQNLEAQLQAVTAHKLSVLDALPQGNLAERVTAIVLDSAAGASYPAVIAGHFARLQQMVDGLDVRSARVVVFGGGTGLSNVVGGDSTADRLG